MYSHLSKIIFYVLQVSYNLLWLFVDASGNPVTQLVISVTDASGNSVTGKSLKKYFNLYFHERI